MLHDHGWYKSDSLELFIKLSIKNLKLRRKFSDIPQFFISQYFSLHMVQGKYLVVKNHLQKIGQYHLIIDPNYRFMMQLLKDDFFSSILLC